MTNSGRIALNSVLIATVLSVVGFVADRVGQTNMSTLGETCAVLGALLLLPGWFFVVLWAMIYSPAGGHGASDFQTFVAPATWLVYFAVGVIGWRSKMKTGTTPK
jgi:hypothetical protein